MKRSYSKLLGLFIIFAGISFPKHDAFCQEPANQSSLKVGGFLDAYAAHDFNDPFTDTRPYTTQAFYEDETRINLGMLEAKVSSENYRSRVAMQAGDSVESNYAAEKDLFWRYVQEASAGLKLTDRLWADGGVYLAHVGFESFNSRDNWNYTRSLTAEFSPYYETGGKLSYQISDNLTAQAHLVRGWQNISSSAEPMYGMQLSYTPDSKTQLIYANLLGHQFGGYRTFHDFIAKRDLTDSFSLAAQFDFGSQERESDSSTGWYGFSVMSKYKVSPKWSVGTRVEHFQDPHQVVVSTLSGQKFNVTGLSANVDYEIQKNLFWRTEFKTYLGSNSKIFPEDQEGDFSGSDNLIVTSLSYSFDIGDLTW